MQTHVSNLSLNDKGQRGKAGELSERLKRGSDRSQQRECERGGKERERKRENEKKRENKTTGKVGEKRRRRKPPECFFAPTGQKVTA